MSLKRMGDANPLATIFIPTDHDANLGNHRVQNISGAGSHRFEFQVPIDFAGVNSIKLYGAPSSGAAGSGKDIDLFSDYAGIGEIYNTHSQSDTTSTYDLTGFTDKIFGFDIQPLFTDIQPSDFCGIFIDHKSIGGAIKYFGIIFIYVRKI